MRFEEFDYSIRREEDGRYFVRIRSTGEETEASPEVVRVLWQEQNELRGITDRDKTLSLDVVCEDLDSSAQACWLRDPRDEIEALLTAELERSLFESLNDRQKTVYTLIVREGRTFREAARLCGKSPSSVADTMAGIRKAAAAFT